MTNFAVVAYAIVAALSAARIIRLLTVDHFPPIQWARERYLNWAEVHAPGYALLGICAYCMGFWVALPIVVWGLLSDWDTVWLWVNAVFALAYVASIIVRFDGDDE